MQMKQLVRQGSWFWVSGLVLGAGLLAAPSAQATSCVPAVEETLSLALATAQEDEVSLELGKVKFGIFDISRSIPLPGNPGTPPYCVVLGGSQKGVFLERVEVIQPAKATEQYLNGVEAKRSPRSMKCGSKPYRAVHPGVYKFTESCGGVASKAPESWPADARLRVDESRSTVSVEYEGRGSAYTLNYNVVNKSFPEDEFGEGCAVGERGPVPALFALFVLGGLAAARRKRVRSIAL